MELQLIIELIEALDNYPSCQGAPTEATISNEWDVLDEISSLIEELVEVAPDTQRCLSEGLGLYGPLAFPFVSQSQLRTRVVAMPVSNWPRRLAQDYRAVLEELGFQTLWSPQHATSKVVPAIPARKPSTRRPSSASEELQRAPSSEEQEILLRREQLLVEGKMRWEEFKRSQDRLL